MLNSCKKDKCVDLLTREQFKCILSRKYFFLSLIRVVHRSKPNSLKELHIWVVYIYWVVNTINILFIIIKHLWILLFCIRRSRSGLCQLRMCSFKHLSPFLFYSIWEIAYEKKTPPTSTSINFWTILCIKRCSLWVDVAYLFKFR